MKKLFILTLTMVTFLVQAQTDNSAENLINFIDIIKNHKNDWLSYVEDFHKAKFDLIKDEHNKIFDMKKAEIQKFKTGDVSALYEDSLNEMIKFHKNSMQEWKNLYDQYREKARGIYERHVGEISKFEQSQTKTTNLEEVESSTAE